MTGLGAEVTLLLSRIERAVDQGDMPAPTMNLLSDATELLSALAAERDQAISKSVADREWALDWQRAVITESALRAEAAAALAAVTAERDQARAEVERLHSWDGLMELLDEHWPEEFLPTIPDDEKRDPGPRIVSLICWVKQARQMLADAPHGAHCSSLIPVPDPPRYGCDCWRAGL